ncbi:24065_t:CDS:2, partial [Gigaspora margarita]
VKFDHELANSRDRVYTYCVQDVFHHRIGSLLPDHEFILQYLQIPTILQGLKNILDQVNPYVANFRSIADLPIENIENLVICIHTNILELDQRTHNTPMTSQVAAIWVDDDPIIIDEIQNFVEACWISAPEAAWRILGFKLNGMNPAITRLQVHLKDQQRVIVDKNSNLEKFIEEEQNCQTTLTEFFKMNAQDLDTRNILYANFSLYYTLNKATKTWATSFDDLKTVNSIKYNTFKESALHRGFFQNDIKHQLCISEARNFQMPDQLQELFAILLIFGDISDSPLRVQAVLQRVNLVLQWHSKSVFDFDLPELLPEINTTIPEAKEFSEYLLRIGNGTEPTIENNSIWLPDKIVISAQNKQDHISLLLDAIYPNLAANSTNTDFITERAILTPLNSTVVKINKQIVERFSGEQYTYFSLDSVLEDTLNLYPIKFLNTLTPQDLSSYTLALKINVSIMLLRNLDPINGLCNRTRLICCVTGSHQDKCVFIPRIPLLASEDSGLPFILERKQFCLAFALMINKSQDQTIPHIGLYFPQLVFSHGQLYVAMSRVCKMHNIKVVVENGQIQGKNSIYTQNVVFREDLNY